jgi:hypothetical protein
MTKAEAREKIDALGLPEPQAKAARRTLTRATRSESIDVVIMDNGDLQVRRSRPGHVGMQVFEDTIRPDGSKEVVQKAYDASGNLVHLDPKGGTP